MMPYFTKVFGNAGSGQHFFGWQANEAVEQARKSIAKYFNSHPSQVIFTSGATESNNLALTGYLTGLPPAHLITSSIEHKAVLEVFENLEYLGWRVSYLSPNSEGIISVDSVLQAIIPGETKLISLMWVNNELGTINPIHELAELCLGQDIIFHSDATQAIGKLDVNLGTMPDLISFSGHKIYSPKGIGGLLVKKGMKLRALLLGGGQERNLRSGTLAVQQIVALGASFLRLPIYLAERDRIGWYQQRIENTLKTHFSNNIVFNGICQARIPHILNITLQHVDWENMFRVMPQIAFSNGSACNARQHLPSHVLLALGHQEANALSTLRISLSHMTTDEDVKFLEEYLVEKIGLLYTA
jgi:cysteine desulfurase